MSQTNQTRSEENMTSVEVVNQSTKSYSNLRRTVTYLEGRAGKHHATIAVAHGSDVQVIVHNAANRCWRGMGKNYPTIDKALAAYKTPEVRAIIQAAADAAKAAA